MKLRYIGPIDLYNGKEFEIITIVKPNETNPDWLSVNKTGMNNYICRLGNIKYVFNENEVEVLGAMEKKRVFSVDSKCYDWWTNLKVMARNSLNGIYENCSNVGKVTIVLFNDKFPTYDEFDVEKEMNETDWSDKTEDYTLYNDQFQLVGFVYAEKK